MKKQFCFLVFTLSLTVSYGQKFSKEYFAKNGMSADETNSYYYRTGKKIERDGVMVFADSVFTYYTASNKIRSMEVYADDGNSKTYEEYYENGQMKKNGRYREGRQIGHYSYYYPDGNYQMGVEYPDDVGEISHYPGYDFKILNYWDSTGNQIVKDGNGFCKCYSVSYTDNILRSEGKVENGLRDLAWKGYSNDTLQYKETFSKGKFMGGVSYRDGKEIAYDEIEIQAEYPGGLEKMSKFIGNTLRYPSYARRMGIEGKVFVQFVVDRDGSIRDIKVIKGVHSSIDEEAARVVGLMPNWIPGKQRGIDVNSRFVLPIKYKLDGRKRNK